MTAYFWMNSMKRTGQANIQHKLNHGTKKRMGKYPVDGWYTETNTIYQFHGCSFHGHGCHITKSVKTQKWRKTRAEKFEKTHATTKYSRECGYNVVEMLECDYKQYCKDKPEINDMIPATRPTFHQNHKGKVSENQILAAVSARQLFGMVEVDIDVPEQRGPKFRRNMTPAEYFQEMSPLFCNTEVPFKLIGGHMQDNVKRCGLSEKPRRLLVGEKNTKQIFIASPLLKWYLDHGMKVIKVYQVVEFQAQTCFKEFVHEVSEARRAGDAKPEMAVIADTNKTIGNYGYGSLTMDKTKHRAVKYLQGEREVCLPDNDPQFRKLEAVDDPNEIYEVELVVPRN